LSENTRLSQEKGKGLTPPSAESTANEAFVNLDAMKLASYHDDSRDGQLIVVSHDLQSACFVTEVATRLQQVLDDWNFLSPQLELVYRELNQGKRRQAFEFDPSRCMTPLPRPPMVLSVQTLSPGEGLPPKDARLDATIQPSGAWMMGGCQTLPIPDATQALICQAHWVAITGDIAWGAPAETAQEGVRLLALAHTTRAVTGEPGEPAPAHWGLAMGLCPVAITPDEISTTWPKAVAPARVRLDISAGNAHDATARRGPSGSGSDTVLPAAEHQRCGERLAQAAQHRPLVAGTVLCMPLAQEATERMAWPPSQEATLHLAAWPADAAASGRTTALFGALNQPIRRRSPP
jgi:fumarylacetoacetate (FAA) hydrolase